MMTEKIVITSNLKLCACNCGQFVKYNKYHPRKFIKGHQNRGMNNPMYKNGWYKDKKGYIRLLKRGYFSSNKRGYVLAHQYVFQEHYECCMLPWGDIHHINEIKDDNRIENLEGKIHGKHSRLHRLKDKLFNGNRYRRKDMSGRRCSAPDCKDPMKTHIEKQYNRPLWHHGENGYLCHSCCGKLYYLKNKK